MPVSSGHTGATTTVTTQRSTNEKLDIEHAEVADDPREWSSTRKVSQPPVLVCRQWSLTNMT